ncbi:hypothetical protein [Methylocystis rosea]|uniref:hypothetical protein n=1 Tax=Methylocystis rosea TaxID=173366 RepID=UPI0012EC74D0|nr:hypothetical protein [Methylocystis rosea]
MSTLCGAWGYRLRIMRARQERADLLDQANVGWTATQRVASRPPQNDDEIDAMFAEIPTAALDIPFREDIAPDEMALSLELLVEMILVKRLVRAIEQDVSR